MREPSARLQDMAAAAMNSSKTISGALATTGLDPSEARILLAHVLRCNRAWLAAHGGESLAGEAAKAFDALVRRRLAGEPIAYLTGRREFHDIDLEVTPDVLIPRPETELLVDFALARIARGSAARILDLGSGSGAVALAIAKARPSATVLGTDASPAALAIARRNARRLGISNAAFIESDWFERVGAARFDIVVANPPYIPAGDPHLLEGDVRFEPRGALTPGTDGLAAIRRIIDAAGDYIVPHGWLALEHGYDQGQLVSALLDVGGFADVLSMRDIAGITRMTAGRRR